MSYSNSEYQEALRTIANHESNPQKGQEGADYANQSYLEHDLEEARMIIREYESEH